MSKIVKYHIKKNTIGLNYITTFVLIIFEINLDCFARFLIFFSKLKYFKTMKTYIFLNRFPSYHSICFSQSFELYYENEIFPFGGTIYVVDEASASLMQAHISIKKTFLMLPNLLK